MADDKLTQAEMESLFDGPPAGEVGPGPQGPNDLVAYVGKGAERINQGGQPRPPNAYQDAAERHFQAGLVVGAGDATYSVRDELKRMGCKWHALRERWVAPNADVQKRAKELVARGQATTVAAGPPPIPSPFWKGKRAEQRASRLQRDTVGSTDPNALVITIGKPKTPPPDPAAILLDLEQRGLIELAPGRMERALSGEAATREELLVAFTKADEAFEL